MILSHKHKYIFLKTNKTAGTSIEIALSEFCGPNDIITPIDMADEKIRHRLGFRGPQNYRYGDIELYNHISATEIKSHVGEDIWGSYYKFCFERNPWDRVISLYYWRCRYEDRPSLLEFLDTELPLLLKQRGFELYTIDGEIAVDKVYFYEQLQAELTGLAERLGLPQPLTLPNAKGQFRKDKRHYRDIISEEEKAKIAKIFEREICLYGYQF